MARIEALHDKDPGVLSQTPIELAIAHVDREDHRRTALQQAVGESAGRSAGVQAALALDRDAQLIQRVLQLDAASGDELLALLDDELGVLGDQLARLVDGRAVPSQADAAGA